MTCRGHAEFAINPVHSDTASRASKASAPSPAMSGHAQSIENTLSANGAQRSALIKARAPKATNKGLQSLFLRKHAILQRKEV